MSVEKKDIAAALGLNETQLEHLIRNAKDIGNKQGMRDERAPDGGPISMAHLAPTLVSTVTVTRKSDGATMVINRTDYRAALHTIVDETRDQTAPPPEILISSHTDEELAGLSLAVLKTLPEFLEVASEQGDAAPKTKQAVVDAILLYREKARTQAK